ncbi:hypothetical protein TrVE_jg5969 [Triparma verrucosa]|uniref:GTP-binding protein Obg/CgtA n=1 Tax=Triparma verrucosa TaxID=1606542 RepID=A0A9W7EUM3_9STRA|nr:hypothetical protein TrVE_jg5969 [Triparma verrucosa]
MLLLRSCLLLVALSIQPTLISSYLPALSLPSKLVTSTSPLRAAQDDYQFFDTTPLNVAGGPGGTGCVSFLREKGEPLKGPSGGSGSNGGSVWLQCDERLNTLSGVRQRIHVKGSKGENGKGKSRDGKKGRDVVIKVPPGTIVREGGKTAREAGEYKVAGELKKHGDKMLVARGGRGGRGNKAFKSPKNKAPCIAERGGMGAQRWLNLELKLVGDVGVIGMPNAGKSTLLSRSTNAKPKIADYAFTTIIPNLGVCDLEGGEGLVLCDIPGLIEGASDGLGMGHQFLRHVQRNKLLLHIVDGSSEDPVGNFNIINRELEKFDELLASRPQVVVVNKIDLEEVRERSEGIIGELKKAAGHSRVLPISAMKSENVKELMFRLKKFADAQPEVVLPEAMPNTDLGTLQVEADSDAFHIETDPSYPGQWRIVGEYIEGIAKMTHWEYPEAVERFGRIIEATGISAELEKQGAEEGDLIMIDKFDFDFSPAKTNPYIPPELLAQDELILARERGEKELRWGTGQMVDDSEDVVGDPRSPEAWVVDLSKEPGFDDEDWDDEAELELLEDFSAFDRDDEGEGDEGYVFEEGDEMFTS